MHFEHRLYRSYTACPSCGIAMPDLPMCRVTHTCVECARKILGENCLNCPDRDECEKEVQGIKMFRELEKRLSTILPDLIEVISEEVEKMCEECCEKYDKDSINMFIRTALSIVNSLMMVRDPRTWLTRIFKPEMIRWIIRAPTSVIELSQRCLSALKDYSEVLSINFEIILNIFRLLLLKFLEDRCNYRTFIETSLNRDLANLFLSTNFSRRSI